MRHFQKVENGAINVKVGLIETVAKALKVPPCYLMQGSQSSDLVFNDVLQVICPIEILDMVSVGIQVINTDGLFLYVNKPYCAMFKSEVSDFVRKKNIFDVLYEKDEIPLLKEYLKKLVKEQPAPTPYYTRNRAIDGSPMPVKVDWNYIRDSKGQVVGFVSVIHFHPSW